MQEFLKLPEHTKEVIEGLVEGKVPKKSWAKSSLRTII